MPRRTISIPLISSGIYGYPEGPCLREHVETLRGALQTIAHDLQEVRIVCYEGPEVENTMPMVPQYLTPMIQNVKQESPSAEITQMAGLPFPPPPPPPPIQNDLAFPPPPPPPELERDRILPGSEVVKHHPFTPKEMDSIISRLPDPDKHPMQYVRRLEQIRSVYGATWTDLAGITSTKASECFLPIIQKALDASKVERLNDYQSGLTYIEQLKKWAQERLSDQAGSIQDVQQEPDEAVEKYAARLNMHFEDLGYSIHIKTQAALLVRSFIEGLQDDLKEEVTGKRPEVSNLSFQEALTIVKAYQRALQKQEKNSEKSKAKKKPTMYLSETTAPVMVYQAQDRYNPPREDNRQPLLPRNYRERRDRDDQNRPLCWECGSPEHIRRDCPYRLRRGNQNHDDRRRPPPRS